jgi:signal transduction histidine kinase
MLSTDLLKRYSDNWDEDEKEKHFKRIQDTILKMTQLMENVLLIGRMDSGRFQFNPEKVDFFAFLTSTAENIEFNTGDKYKIDIDFDNTCQEIYIDENLLGLIITNLLTNAVKYSSKDKKIILKVECHDQRTVSISIIDHGIGIPDKELHHLFKSFYRASNVGSIAGYGLGLHIVKKCVEAHNGVIEVESEVGKGTTFSVTIPIDKPEESHFNLDI